MYKFFFQNQWAAGFIRCEVLYCFRDYGWLVKAEDGRGGIVQKTSIYFEKDGDIVRFKASFPPPEKDKPDPFLVFEKSINDQNYFNFKEIWEKSGHIKW